jgi:GAF domain-containing protein
MMRDKKETRRQPDAEHRQRAATFGRYVLAAAVAASGVGAAEIVLSYSMAYGVLRVVGLLTLAIGLCSFIAAGLARAGRLTAGVYLWSISLAFWTAFLPVIVFGLLPIVIAGATVAILTIALFVSPRLIGQATLWAAAFVLLATLLETWAPPWERLNLETAVPLIPLIINPVGVIFIAVLTRLLGKTLQNAVEAAQANAGQLEQSQTALLKRTTELEALTANLQQRSQEQDRLNRELQLAAMEAERRATQLAASSQVARAISQVRNLDQLLAQVTHLISGAFGYYHVGIFIVDEIGRYAVLIAANSEGGQRMLARVHRLEVGQQGIVGYVTSTGEPRIALDVGADAVHFTNPDLPDTRSEMALPLKVGGQIIGALDVQSTQEAAFTQEDIGVLSALADQIAIAIENARLFEKTQAALHEAEAVQRRYVRQQWKQLAPTLETTGYEYHTSSVPSVGNATLPEIEQVILQGQTITLAGADGALARTAMAVPIKLGDHLLGVIDLHEVDAERQWTEEEITFVTAIADQTALALENARLFEQTQRRAQREQLTAEIASRMRAAPDVEGVLRTAVQEIRRALGATHGVIRLEAAAAPQSPNSSAAEQVF